MSTNKHPQPTAKIELITPEWAIKELEKHEDELARGLYCQRPFTEAVAQKYAVAMQNGHWLLNDTGIMYDTRGWLRDGRHRLWAVVMSGCSVEMWVFRNCADKIINGIIINVVDTVDVGKTRNVGQQLAIDGVASGGKIAAAVRVIARICCGFNSRLQISVIQTRQITEMFGTQITKVMDGFHNNSRLCAGYMVGTTAMYRNLSPGPADQFCADYFSMENLAPGSPVIALQKYLQINGGSTGAKADATVRAVALALYHYERGTKVTALRHSDIGTQWLAEKQKGNVAKIRQIVGLDFHDHRS